MLINKQNLALASLAPQKDSRFTLKGIQVSTRGTAVTDGYIAARVSLPNGDNAQAKNFPLVEGVKNVPSPDAFILPADAAKKISSAIPKNSSIPVLQNVLVGESPSGAAAFAVTDLDTSQVFQPRMLTGQFPNIDAVWPKDEDVPAMTISADAEELIKVLKALVEFDGLEAPNGNRGKLVTLKFYSHDKAFRIQTRNIETGQQFDAIQMPCNLPESEAKKPAQPNAQAKAWKLSAPDAQRISCTESCGRKASYGYSPNGGAPFFYYCESDMPEAARKVLKD